MFRWNVHVCWLVSVSVSVVCVHQLILVMLQVIIWLNVHRFESSVQIAKLQDLVNRSKLARCRGRFVCPVILYNGKVKASHITSCF